MGVFTSLKAKFILAIVMILTAAIAVSSWWTLKMQREQLIAATNERVSILTTVIEKSITQAMLEGRNRDVQTILQEVGKHEDIERVSIFDDEGTVKVSSDPKEIGRKISLSRFDRYWGYLGANAVVFQQEDRGQMVHSLLKPILNRPACHRCHDLSKEANGILHIDFSLAKARAQIASVHTFVLFSAILTIASLSLALWFLLSRLVNRPVSTLVQTMRRAEGGDLEARVPVKSKDELGRLGESFNYMISSLQEAKHQLEAEHERQLEQAEKMATLGQLASAIAHEVKNPLGGVSGAIQVLAEDYSVNDPKREIIEEILNQIRRLDKTVKDLLSYARPTLPEPVSCRPNDLVEGALFFIRQQVNGSHVSIVTDYAERLPHVHADPQQIKQVILNIALNAVQAMPEGGTLTVKTRAISHEQLAISGGHLTTPGTDAVELAISDTGKGILPENRKRIFQPFFTTKHRGTGLGLPICQKIVEQHGGFIYIETEVGKGTTVIIRMPVRGSQ